MIISSEHIEALKPYVENIVEIVGKDNVQELLDAIDDVIMDNILANNDEPNEEGLKLQKIYDEIYVKNQ